MPFRSRIARFALLCAAVSALALGCSSSNSSPGGGGRGSAACNDWQNAVCGLVQQCGADPQICEQSKEIVCKSDPAATACAAKFRADGCSADTTGCEFGDLADPAPVIAACKQLAQGFCDAEVRCNGMAPANCNAVYETQLQCNQGKLVGVKPTFDSCLADLKVADCAATTLPPNCTNVLLTAP